MSSTFEQLSDGVLASAATLRMVHDHHGEQVSEAFEEPSEIVNPDDHTVDFWHYVNESVLEVVECSRKSWGHDDEPVITSFELVLGTGGPDIRAILESSGEGYVIGHWGNDAFKFNLSMTVTEGLFSFLEEANA
jgi:hypothetical protein